MAFLLAGCGSSSNSPSVTASGLTSTSAPGHSTPSATTASAAEKVPLLDLSVTIPGLQGPAGGRLLPRRYSCDGADISPPISWGKVPAHTVEIDLFITSIEQGSEYTEWAVAGLSPRLRGLAAGHLPPEALLGRNRSKQLSYTLCPRKGALTNYAVLFFPLTHKLLTQPGFDAEKLALRAVHTAPSEGQLFFSYKRA